MATRAIVQRGLLGLPVDVKRHIVDKIWPPKSQRDLALVCRETYMLVQPEMYKSLDFKIETTHDTKITNMLTEHNLDLAHVRHVLSQLVYEEDDNYVAQHCRIAKGVFSRLMSLLPSDSLLSFYATADMTLSLSWYRELLERQARITSLSVNTILFKKTRIGQFDDEHPAFGNKIQHVESLYLLPHQDHDLEFCHYVLHHCNSLKILTIAMANEKAVSSLPAFPENDWQDTAYMPGMLTRSVFRSQLRAGPDQTITGIRELELSNVGLTHSRGTYLDFLNLETLKSLELTECPGVWTFFHRLIRALGNRIVVNDLTLVHDADELGQTLDALELLLLSFHGLKYLHVEIGYCPKLPAMKSIVQHARSLRELRIHTWQPGAWFDMPIEHVWSCKDMVWLCGEVRGLSALACAFPRIWLDNGASTCWYMFMRAISQLSYLVTLNMSTYPIHETNKRTFVETEIYWDLTR